MESEFIKLCAIYNEDDEDNKHEQQDGPRIIRIDTSRGVSASELAEAKAQNWLLQKNLEESKIVVESLEHMVREILRKNNELLNEIFKLNAKCQELNTESQTQREYHAMERNALLIENRDLKKSLNESKEHCETIEKHSNEVMKALKEAHEKIYIMGVQFLRLKRARRKTLALVNSEEETTSEYSYDDYESTDIESSSS